ncbi:hypothetical protein [Simiduia aestuariiviva]|uniref:Uncharacterized protein n=1 Tax=Simiduia aestuariiviva TaxID=1510459 RepID=A0A839UMD0_9GAMM|nr:hypothetical protein [Simiduia aestuariiviva]MBB3169344.1 hypothetical protein [Simiduia aestuariiviva]
MIRNPVILTLLMFAISVSNCFAEQGDELVYSSLGRLLAYQNQATRYKVESPTFAHSYLPGMIQKEYDENIYKLSKEQQIEFIWGVISFAKLGSDGTEDLAHLIYDCCPKEFIQSVDVYLSQAEKYEAMSPNYVDQDLVHKAKYFKRSAHLLLNVLSRGNGFEVTP